MIKIDAERMAKILGVPTPEDFDEKVSETPSDAYGYTYREAIEAGSSEEEAEQKAMDAEFKERCEHNKKYINALVSVFEKEAANLDLEVTELKSRPGVYALTPTESWRESAHKTRTIVNGIGGWYFRTLKEFLSSGPYTPRTAVEKHIGYLGRQWELYGYSSPRQQISAY